VENPAKELVKASHNEIYNGRQKCTLRELE
jgi:hypothetical protein